MLLSKSSLDLESSLAENDAILRFERKTRPNPGGTTSIARPLNFSIPASGFQDFLKDANLQFAAEGQGNEHR